MYKKVLKFIFIGLVVTLINVNYIYASSGALKKNSIKTCPDGKTYGYHGSDKHWHEAEATNVSSGWSAVGGVLPGDPCPSENTSTQEQNNNSSNSSSNTGTNNSEIYNSNINNNSSEMNNINNISDENDGSNQINTTTQAKSNDTGISYLSINDKQITPITDTIDYTITDYTVNVVVKLNDNKASYEIQQGETKNLAKNKINEIKIIVTAEDGTQKTYTLNIKRKNVESKVRLATLKVNNYSVDIRDDNQLSISVFNSDKKLNIEYELTDKNAKLIILKDDNEIKDGEDLIIGKNNFKLTIVDKNEDTYDYNLTVTRMTKAENIISYILTFEILGGVGCLVYFIIKKLKNNKVITNSNENK